MFGDIVIEPDNMFFIARDKMSFSDQNGFEADIGWWGVNGSSKALCLAGDLRLSNAGDGVYLRDPSGRVIDCVIWGSALDQPNIWRSYGTGKWFGCPVGDLGWGHVLYRVERTGEGNTKDTNRACDWTSVRPRYPGQSRFDPFPFREIGETEFGICPFSGSEVLNRAISEASEVILVNVYEFTSDWIVSGLIGARSRGIRVKVLLEGNPVGGISLMEDIAISRMLSAGIEVRMMITDTSSGIRDRYRYDHAKYMVVDGLKVVVSTDNFKDTSFPPPGSNVYSGTRGWICAVSSGEMAMDLEMVFNEDFSGPDIIIPEIDDELLDMDYPEDTILSSDPVPVWARLQEVDDVEKGRIVVSPDHLAPEGGPLVDLIRSARKEILIELMDIDMEYLLGTMPNWTATIGTSINTSDTSIGAMNPFVMELLDAACRGVRVRMLLDGTDFNGDGIPENHGTVGILKEIIQQRGVDESFEIMLHPSPRFLIRGETSLIHNKGMVIDGESVWISSFNWGPTSGLENREVGMIISSREIANNCRECILFDMGGSLQDLFTISGIWARGEFPESGPARIETGFKFEWRGYIDCSIELICNLEGPGGQEEIILRTLDIPKETIRTIHLDSPLEPELEEAGIILRISTGDIQCDITTLTVIRPPDTSKIEGPSFFSAPWVPIAMILLVALGLSIIMSTAKRRDHTISEE
jgi:phosphatidylserine/phosphatidylglycerophosphate/cardiolipin synthase-like enzyme